VVALNLRRYAVDILGTHPAFSEYRGADGRQTECGIGQTEEINRFNDPQEELQTENSPSLCTQARQAVGSENVKDC